MMAGNPNWWRFVPPSQQSYSSSSSTYPLSFLPENFELSQSWSQLLFGDMAEDDDGIPRKYEPWADDQIYDPSVVLKHEVTHFEALVEENCLPGNIPWSHLPGTSFPSSCTTGSSKSILNFESPARNGRRSRHSDQSSECNNIDSGATCKKIKVQPHMKVRKEKLGDRITSLHQLVSPFGKTDTASVLLEAIGYIRFLQGQIQALSTSYIGTAPLSKRTNQLSLLNDICIKKKKAHSQENQDVPKDLRSRGLCLVPLSCTQNVGDDYWSAATNREH